MSVSPRMPCAERVPKPSPSAKTKKLCTSRTLTAMLSHSWRFPKKRAAGNQPKKSLNRRSRKSSDLFRPDNIHPRLPWPMANFSSAMEKERDSRSEEHTSELQSRENLVCRLLLE